VAGRKILPAGVHAELDDIGAHPPTCSPAVGVSKCAAILDRVNRTREELRIYAKEHLLYEVEMLRGLTERLLEVFQHREAGGDVDDLYPLSVRNAMVESFASRARTLVEFLYRRRSTWPSDVLAAHYVAGDWDPPELPDALKDVKARVDKGVAHLTYDRLDVTEEEKPWSYGRIWLDLSAMLRNFADQASPELLEPEVTALIVELTEPIASGTVSRAASLTHIELIAVTTSTASQSDPFLQGIPTQVSELLGRAPKLEQEPPTG
jgi:hypothetical protein